MGGSDLLGVGPSANAIVPPLATTVFAQRRRDG